MTQQWQTRINGTIAENGMIATLDITGKGDYYKLAQLRDDLRTLGFECGQMLVPVEETQPQEAKG